MEVSIVPPEVIGTGTYVIAVKQPRISFATADGSWVDMGQLHRAIHFASARDAISYAEGKGWKVKNKRDGNSLIDVPRSF